MTLAIEAPPVLGDARLPGRFWSKVVDAPSGCWLWTAAIDRDGYGHWDHEVSNRVHRVSYSLLVAPIPSGMVIDHLCRVRSCVNPHHLRAVTNRENLFAPGSMSPCANRSERCKRGHLLRAPNLVVGRTVSIACRTCARAHSKKHYEARKGRIVDFDAFAASWYEQLMASHGIEDR